MNTTKHGMRTLLASAAAGALVIGSASGALAHPAKPTPPKTPKAGVMQVRMVDVHNSPFNVAKPRSIKVKANVWDSVKNEKPSKVQVTLAQFDKKGGIEVASPVIDDITVTLTTKAKKDRKAKSYYGSVSAAELLAQLTVDEKKALETTPVLMCISGVVLEGTNAATTNGKYVTKKIGKDCFRVVNVPVETK